MTLLTLLRPPEATGNDLGPARIPHLRPATAPDDVEFVARRGRGRASRIPPHKMEAIIICGRTNLQSGPVDDWGMSDADRTNIYNCIGPNALRRRPGFKLGRCGTADSPGGAGWCAGDLHAGTVPRSVFLPAHRS